MNRNIKAQAIMNEFAIATGLTDSHHEVRRYLWTDAFAVCTYLGFYRQTGEQGFLQDALSLIDQVHFTLGRHRHDSDCSGWLSGLDAEHAKMQPTKAGLRIGKPMNERQPDEVMNETLEWEQDGQYFHYLTKWMHALDCASRHTGDATYNQWALELAKAAHAAFVYTLPNSNRKRLYWKMSIDLSRPLVASMGQHDALDGLITYQQLVATAKTVTGLLRPVSLDVEIADMVAMCSGGYWATQDPLGIGGLLVDAFRLLQLIDCHDIQQVNRLNQLLNDTIQSLQWFLAQNPLKEPAEYRLAFRELGLSIGLHAVDRMQLLLVEQSTEELKYTRQLVAALKALANVSDFCTLIEGFWLEPEHQTVTSWQNHLEINEVMLATSLAPDGYLKL